MNDRSNEFEKYTDLTSAREQGFFDKSLSIRFAIGLLFTLCLFAFLHFREIRVEVLELNSTAPGYIVAQSDFDFLDEEAAIILREEAVRDVGKIYRLSDKEIQQRRMEFENVLIHNQEGRNTAENSPLEEVYKTVYILEQLLTQLRLTDSRTFQRVTETHSATQNYQIFTPHDLLSPIILPNQIWETFRQSILNRENIQEGTLKSIIDYFSSKGWMVEEDFSAQRQLRRRIQSSIPDTYTHINAGSRIIDQGERVTARHVAMIQAMENALNDNRELWHPLSLLGTLMLTLLLTGISAAYFKGCYPDVLYSNRKLFLFVTVLLMTMGFAKLTELLFLASKENLIEMIRYPVFVPFAAILLCSLMNPTVAAFGSGFLTVILTMALTFDQQGFMIMNLTAAFIAILSAHSLRRRKEIFVICGKTWLCCVLVILSLSFYQNLFWNKGIFFDLLGAAAFMLLTAVLVVGLLPLLETAFHVMTDVTLTEYMDPNHDLLRRLIIEAPGTYQHSVVVGNLAETAALAIGANGLFCRVATLYHDIGKMATPHYFTENQHSGMNIHQLLTPKESAEVIIAHVSEGVSLARKAGLPEQFIDIIKEHHGTTLVYYFYRKQLEQMGGDKKMVNEQDFRYAGPKPHSKESGIIMIADTVEAASRSLDRLDEAALMELASRLIRDKVEDGQFEECLLTLEELSIVKTTLVKTLVAYAHARVKYPTREAPSAPVDEAVNI